MGGSETCDGVMPTGGKLLHRAEEEITLCHVGMRHLERGSVYNQIINRHNVNVHQTVDVTTLFIAM